MSESVAVFTGLLKSALRPVHFRGKARVLHGLCPREGIRESSVFGSRVRLDLSNYIERSVYLHTYEPEETRIVRAALKPGQTFVDVGAGFGYFTLLAASAVGPRGRVWAFEPNPREFGKLSRAVSENGLSQVTVEQAALGDAPGEAAIYIPAGDDYHAPTMVENEGGRPFSVRVRALDDVMGAGRIDFLKMDVEGFEPNVVRGAARLFSERRVGAVLCEFNDEWLSRNHSSPEHLLGLFSSYGFRVTGTPYNPRLALQTLLLTPDSKRE